ncbi:NAD(P)-dependent oxidoreductase [Paenarthrobacter sp. NyZ202]|uniref:NAD(P)-dependent oxidoreductase n=1 Tax=Paenarthrobacter sp. NyZ202 TaxID=3402689 RepID=UPI003CE6FFDB
MSTIGFIGLGNMGYPMASRLADAGHRMIVSDQAETVSERFLKENPGSAPASSTTAWQEADIIITMLPNSAIVEAVLVGGGVSAAASLNTLFIDMSSSEPLRSRELGKQLESQGMRYLDAPVSGGVRGAENGQLAIMVGGRWQDLDQAKELFDVLGKSVIHVGEAGAGHAAKALNNLVSAASVAATVEALRVGEQFGIDPAVLTDVLNASSGRSNTSENKVRQFMLSGTFGSGFPIGLMTKDIKIATSLADSLGIPVPFSHDCENIWQSTLDAGHGAEDHTRMYEFLTTHTPAFNDERQINA